MLLKYRCFFYNCFYINLNLYIISNYLALQVILFYVRCCRLPNFSEEFCPGGWVGLFSWHCRSFRSVSMLLIFCYFSWVSASWIDPEINVLATACIQVGWWWYSALRFLWIDFLYTMWHSIHSPVFVTRTYKNGSWSFLSRPMVNWTFKQEVCSNPFPKGQGFLAFRY